VRASRSGGASAGNQTTHPLIHHPFCSGRFAVGRIDLILSYKSSCMYKTDTMMIILICDRWFRFLLQAWASGTGSYLVLRRVRVYAVNFTIIRAAACLCSSQEHGFFFSASMRQDDTDIYCPSCSWT
jgi:hypothetical protein